MLLLALYEEKINSGYNNVTLFAYSIIKNLVPTYFLHSDIRFG